MNQLTGTQIVSHFTSELLTKPNTTKLQPTSISRNVFKLTNNNREILLYVKGRACAPHKWGVTKNVIDRLNSQPLHWFVVLLYEVPSTGYLLSKQDVDNYIGSAVWPLGGDGDYKPATGSYLKNSTPFHSIESLFNQLESRKTPV